MAEAFLVIETYFNFGSGYTTITFVKNHKLSGLDEARPPQLLSKQRQMITKLKTNLRNVMGPCLKMKIERGL